MAQLGRIYWNILNNGTLELAGTTGKLSHDNLWVQSVDGDARIPPWINNAESIYYLAIRDTIKPITCRGFFMNMKYLLYSQLQNNFANMDTSECVDMFCMFYNTGYYEDYPMNLNLYLDTRKVKNMHGLFGQDEGSINGATMINFNGDVSYKDQLFQNCEDMGTMFQNLKNLQMVHDWGSFVSTSKVKTTQYMFCNCNSLHHIYGIQNFNGNSLENASQMFANCWSLQELDVSDWNATKITSMEKFLYSNDTSHPIIVEELDFTNWDFSHCTSFDRAFQLCRSCDIIGIEDFNVSNALTMENMFHQCYELTGTLDLSNWNVSKCKNMAGMFQNCYNLTGINFTGWNTSNVEDFSYMFKGSESTRMNLTSLDIKHFNVSKAVTLASMFEGCSHLTTLDLSGWKPVKCNNTSYMLNHCDRLTSVDMGGWELPLINNASFMFGYCAALVRIYLNITLNPSISDFMFYDSTSLIGENGTTYSASHVNKDYARIDVSGSPGYFSYSKRTVTIQKTGSGTIKVNGSTVDSSFTLTYGTLATLSISPDITNFYYIKSISWNGVDIPIEPTINAITSDPLPLTETGTLAIEFAIRNLHTLTVDSEYEIDGTGAYRYLDQPVLLAKLSGGLISFNGWYKDGILLSADNPFVYTMPDSDVVLTIETGEEVFSNEKVRQFAIQNGDGIVYKLTSHESDIFLDSPDNLGFSKEIETNRIGTSEIVTEEKFNMPNPSGTLYFYYGNTPDKYEAYNKFINFISKKPLTLWQKIPANNIDNIYHIPVEITNVGKSQINKDTLSLECPIEFYGLGFWRLTVNNVINSSSTIDIFNKCNFNVGINLLLKKLSGQPFNNPVVSFYKNSNEYGAIAIDLDNITEMRLNTQDKNQLIDLYINDSETPIADPFKYIDFSYVSDNSNIKFPFPKLDQDKIQIRFSYDGDSGDTKTYSFEYDEEYLSV